MVISKENIDYSLKSIWQRRGRNALTIVSIFIGITTIFIFISFGWGLYDYVESFTTSTAADKITVQQKGATVPGMDDNFGFTDSDLRAVERTNGVYAVEGTYMGAVEIEKSDVKKYVFFGSLNPETNMVSELSDLKIYKGRELTESDSKKVVLGYNYLVDNKIFPKALDINQKILINGEEFRVVGFYEALGNPQDDSNVYMTEESVRIIKPNVIGYGMIIARVDVSHMNSIIENVERNLRNSRNQKVGQEDFYVASFADLIESYTSALGIIVGFIVLIALISVVVSAVNTANTMITSVLERTREIGVIKAVGARNKEIMKIFLFESAFLGFVAGCFGVLAGWIITYVIDILLQNLGWGFLSPHYSWTLFVGCVLFATITGAISGVAPAINASRIKIVDALRYE